jgi:very-short-patch-repair endonuclease
VGDLPTHVGRKSAQKSPDAVIARIAERQHGVVSLEQLESAGIHERGRGRRVRAGRLHRIHRGVYTVGHRGLSEKGEWMAGVLACGPGAVLSHVSAARLWRMLRRPGIDENADGRPSIHVTVPSRAGRRRRNGLRVHRSETLGPDQVTRREGIPVTTPTRTLIDLRRILPQPQFAAALRQAEFLRLPIDRRLKPDRTRSDLEAKFLRLCRRHRLPMPEVNVRLGPYLVDFNWRKQRLAVEVDGFEAHGTRSAFEADRARDADLKLLGFDVIRFTWRQLTSEPSKVAATLRTLLNTDRGPAAMPPHAARTRRK